jgi:hypothetical protein
MPSRHFPVRPNLDQLKHQAKDLLAEMRSGDSAAMETLREHAPRAKSPCKLADAQLCLARSYGLPSWPRLVTACRMTNAIWQGDAETVRTLVLKNPKLLTEDARGVESNWGPPMSYAANLGQDAIIAMLRAMGADDVQYAFDRACLQGQLETARWLVTQGAKPTPGIVMGPCETLNADGLRFLLDMGATFDDGQGDPLAPIALLLQTYSRGPRGKHDCLELLASRGIALPDTPAMAVHRGRIDLLEAHLARNPELLSRTFTHEEIFPPELGCSVDHSFALHGTPLAGTTLLHIAVDYDEIEIARWLLANGADVNAKAELDADGFGGHTALFGCVVSQPYRCGLQRDGAFVRLLLEHGADPNARASLRKKQRFVPDELEHFYRDVTPLGWGRDFVHQEWVNRLALEAIREAGGTD